MPRVFAGHGEKNFGKRQSILRRKAASNLFQGNVLCACEGGEILVFRLARMRSIPMAALDTHRTQGRVDGYDFPIENVSLAERLAHAKGRRVAEDAPGEFFRIFRRADAAEEMARRPFFIEMGVTKTSFAPDFKSSSQAKASASPVMSSRLQRSSAMVSEAPSSSPSMARTQLAASKSFLPMPYPMDFTRMTGMGPKR